MNKANQTTPILPDGITWPKEVPQPQVETVSVSIRKTKIGKDGRIIETTKVVDIPKIKERKDEVNT